MITEFFVVSGVMFWLLGVIVSAILIWCVENEESTVLGTFVVLIGACLLLLLSPMGAWAAASPWRLVFLPVGFVLIGVAWTIPRWGIFLRRVRAELEEEKKQFFRQVGVSPVDAATVPKEQWVAWRIYLVERHWEIDYGIKFDSDTGKLQPPTYAANSERIVSWAVMWPWSMFWTLCRDIIVDGFKALTRWWSKLYGWMAAKFFSDF